MWTAEQRGRAARIARHTKRYPTDLTDEEREWIAPLMRVPGPRPAAAAAGDRVPRNRKRRAVSGRSGCG